MGRIRTIVILLAVVLHATAGFAAGKLRWVEADVSLRPDLTATVTYSVCYQSLGSLHGFYFEGVQETPQFIADTAKAYPGGSGAGIPLSISPVGGGKWDIVLAGGRAIDSGDVIYKFSYNASLLDSGNAGITRADQDLLACLDWAPAQWDEPMERHTIRLYRTNVPSKDHFRVKQ
jgi:hypothetical protein